METMRVPIKNLDPDLPSPTYAHVGDGAVDLRATHDEILQPFERKLIACGVSLAIPCGFAGFVLPRSGLAIKHGVSLVNAPGLIDSNYRGEIKAILINLDPHTPFEIQRGDRIAQLAIMKVANVQFESYEDLPSTERGVEGFGSSGVKR